MRRIFLVLLTVAMALPAFAATKNISINAGGEKRVALESEMGHIRERR